MNILWLPHAPLRTGRTRSDHLIERLARRHHVTVVSYRVHAKSRPWHYLSDLITHRTRRGPPYDELAVHRFPKMMELNGWVLNRALARELSLRTYDVLVVAPAPYLTGYLDFAMLRERMPVVCDYLDGTDWALDTGRSAFEPLYVKSSDAVICVSRGLERQAASLNARSFYVPNGVELARYRDFRAKHTARECKTELGINPDTYVVSIIGMTCSPRLYFVDALVALWQKGMNIALLLVGDSPLLAQITARAGRWRHLVHAVGGVPYANVLPYFMATDLGLSAVDDEPYYQFQSPLKIFEYGAMGKPVLAAPHVEEVAQARLSHVEFAEANAKSLADRIERIMKRDAAVIEPDLERYDWDHLAQQVETILSTTVSDHGSRRIRGI